MTVFLVSFTVEKIRNDDIDGKIFMGTNFNILLSIDCCRTQTQSHLSVISLALLNFRDHRDIRIENTTCVFKLLPTGLHLNFLS